MVLLVGERHALTELRAGVSPRSHHAAVLKAGGAVANQHQAEHVDCFQWQLSQVMDL